jgi:prevent-host-death family protein
MYRTYIMNMENTASVKELRDHLAEVVDRAAHDELTIITRHGREVAAVVPIELVREHRAWEEERVLRIVEERRAAAQPGIPIEDVIDETLARPE